MKLDITKLVTYEETTKPRVIKKFKTAEKLNQVSSIQSSIEIADKGDPIAPTPVLTIDPPNALTKLEGGKFDINIKLDGNNFAIEDIETGKYIGGCGIQNVNWLSRVALVGIMIGDKDYWGKGYGTDAMKTLVTFIFNNMNINKIRLSTFSFNERAIKSYKKCGFTVEGVLKNEIFKDGKYYDEIIMSIFKD